MRKLIRTTLFTAVLLFIGVSTAPAQTYDLVADSLDLVADNDPSDVQCVDQLSSGAFVFYNSNADGIYTWDGSSLSVHTDSTSLNGNIDATSNPIDRCDAVEVDGSGNVYFSFRSSSDTNQPNYIYKTEASNPSNNAFKELDGTLGLAVYNSTLYLASYEFYEDTGNREDGVYSIPTDLSGSPSEVAVNSDLSIDGGIDVSENGTLYGYSNDFGGGDFGQKVVSLDLTANSPSFQVFADPFSSASPLSRGDFSEEGNAEGIQDLNLVSYGESEYVVVYNQTDVSSGEEVGTIKLSDQSISLLFTATDLVGNISVSEYSSAYARPLTVNSAGEVTVASGGGGLPYIATVNDAPPLPVEMAGFDAVQNGSSVELTWETVSETNNAGFRVQHQAPGSDAWTRLDFVESKFDDGTTPEGASYRYTVNAELDVGTHRFRLQQKDLDGSETPSKVVTFEKELDEALSLEAPAPNPAGGTTTLSFGVKEATDATVSVYNVLGQRVKTLYQGTPQPEQMTDVTFNTATLPSGVYFVRLQADGQTQTERLTVVK